MNKYNITIFLLVCYAWIPNSSSLLQQNLKRNLFHKVNVDLQNSINKVFSLLQLNKNFTTHRKNLLLLSMHATMKTIAEKNYPHYKDIKRACKLYFKSKPKASLFNLDKLINILVQEKLTPGNMSMFSEQANKTGINLQLTSFEIPENEEESFAFLKEYLKNVDDSFVFDSPLQKIKDEFEKNKQKVKESRRLKAWKAPDLMKDMTNFRRVFLGKKVTIKRFPFLTSIHESGKFVCAGSIISKLLVITAATCVHTAYYNQHSENQTTNAITVRVGSDQTETGGQLCNVSRVFFHPYYDPDTLSNNLAILKIQKALKFIDKKMRIRRIDFQRMEGDLHSSTKKVLIVGWGDTNAEYSNGKEKLLYSRINILKTPKCIEIYTRKFVNRKNFCAGFSRKGAGACQRDIGGPGIAGEVLIGVVSYGPPVCGSQFAPTVFTNIGYHIAWIDSVIRELPKITQTTTTTTITTSTATRTPIELRANSLTTSVEETTTQSQTFKKKQTKPVMKIRSQTEYPKAIKVLTFVLNGLLSAGQNFNEIISGPYEESDDDANNNTLDTDILRNKFDKVVASNHSDNELMSKTLTGKAEDRSFSKRIKEKPENNINPFSSVMKSLQDYLGLKGLDKAITFSEIYKPISLDSDRKQHHENSNINKGQKQIFDANSQKIKERKLFSSKLQKNKGYQIKKSLANFNNLTHYSEENKSPIDNIDSHHHQLSPHQPTAGHRPLSIGSTKQKIKIQANSTLKNIISSDIVGKKSKKPVGNISNNYETENESGIAIEPISELGSNSVTLSGSRSASKLFVNKKINEFDDKTRKHHKKIEYTEDKIMELVYPKIFGKETDARKGEEYKNKILKIKMGSKDSDSINLEPTESFKLDEDFSGFVIPSKNMSDKNNESLNKNKNHPTFRNVEQPTGYNLISIEDNEERPSIEDDDYPRKSSVESGSDDLTNEVGIAIDFDNHDKYPITNNNDYSNKISDMIDEMTLDNSNLNVSSVVNDVTSIEVSRDDNHPKELSTPLDFDNLYDDDKAKSKIGLHDRTEHSIGSGYNEKEENSLFDQITAKGTKGDDTSNENSYTNAADDMINENGRRFLDYINIK